MKNNEKFLVTCTYLTNKTSVGNGINYTSMLKDYLCLPSYLNAPMLTYTGPELKFNDRNVIGVDLNFNPSNIISGIGLGFNQIYNSDFKWDIDPFYNKQSNLVDTNLHSINGESILAVGTDNYIYYSNDYENVYKIPDTTEVNWSDICIMQNNELIFMLSTSYELYFRSLNKLTDIKTSNLTKITQKFPTETNGVISICSVNKGELIGVGTDRHIYKGILNDDYTEISWDSYITTSQFLCIRQYTYNPGYLLLVGLDMKLYVYNNSSIYLINNSVNLLSCTILQNCSVIAIDNNKRLIRTNKISGQASDWSQININGTFLNVVTYFTNNIHWFNEDINLTLPNILLQSS